MRVYIAAPWVCRDQAREAGEKFKAAGVEITEEWWNHENVEQKFDGSDESHIKNELKSQALKDVMGVFAADRFILLNIQKSEGKAVEQGMALAWSIPIIAVGNFGSNVFHYLDNQYKFVGSVEEAIAECLTS